MIDTLGHSEDIEHAEKIVTASLSRPTHRVSQQDLDSALSQGLLTESQAHEFTKTKLQLEFEQTTQSQKSSNQSSTQKQ